MTFEDAFDKAVKSFYDGKNYDSLEKAGQKLVYNKDYLDSLGKKKTKSKKEPIDGDE